MADAADEKKSEAPAGDAKAADRAARANGAAAKISPRVWCIFTRRSITPS